MRANRFSTAFFYLIAAILALVSMIKVYSLFSGAAILKNTEPLTGFSYGKVMAGAALIEAGTAIFCVLGKNTEAKSLVVAWLGVMFVSYRILKWIAGFPEECPCLGTLARDLPIAQTSVQALLNEIIVLMLGGSLYVWVSGTNRFRAHKL